MDYSEVLATLQHVTYKDWRFEIVHEAGAPRCIQIVFSAEDSETGELIEQKSRKWRLSEYMTESELVQTCLKAVLTAEEHETRERFLYRGVAVFGPHISIQALLEAAQHLEKRAVKG